MPLFPQAAQAGPPSGGGSVTMYTQAAAQALHDAIAHEQDADDKLALSKALQVVLQVQQKNATQQQGGPAQALAGRMAG